MADVVVCFCDVDADQAVGQIALALVRKEVGQPTLGDLNDHERLYSRLRKVGTGDLRVSLSKI